jgi:hypothetical protein
VEAVGCKDVSRLELWADSDRCCATHISTQWAGSGTSLRAQGTVRPGNSKTNPYQEGFAVVERLTILSFCGPFYDNWNKAM